VETYAGIMGPGNINELGDLTASAEGYRITLLDLQPENANMLSGPYVDYRATLLVESAIIENGYRIVHFSDDDPTDLMEDPFALDSVYIDGDILTLEVYYSGGCVEHDFTLFMSPSAFMESYPVQANLYLRHIDHDDACDGYFEVPVGFKISRIAQLYYQMYGQYDDIILNVYDYYTDTPGNYISVIYSP